MLLAKRYACLFTRLLKSNLFSLERLAYLYRERLINHDINQLCSTKPLRNAEIYGGFGNSYIAFPLYLRCH